MEVTFARAMDQRQGPQAEGPERRLHASRHDLARLLRSLAAGRPHRRVEAAQPALRRWCGRYGDGVDGDAALTAGARRQHRRSAGHVRQGAGRHVRHDAARAARLRQAGRRRLDRRAEGGRGRQARELHRAAGARPGAGQGRAIQAAFAPLQRAAALVPRRSATRARTRIMAGLAEKLNDRPRAIKEYEALLAVRSHRRRGGAPAVDAGRSGGRRARDAARA